MSGQSVRQISRFENRGRSLLGPGTVESRIEDCDNQVASPHDHRTANEHGLASNLVNVDHSWNSRKEHTAEDDGYYSKPKPVAIVREKY